MKALAWLVCAAAAAVVAGLLQARESVLLFCLAMPLILGAVVGQVVASVHSMPLRDDRLRSRATEARVRMGLGLATGALGFAVSAGYGLSHLVWFGERVSAVVVDDRWVCGVESGRCAPEYRLSLGRQDLGWTSSCGEYVSTGGPFVVDVDPFGWVPASSPACGTGRLAVFVGDGLWLIGLGAILVVIIFDSRRRTIRSVRPDTDCD